MMRKGSKKLQSQFRVFSLERRAKYDPTSRYIEIYIFFREVKK